MIGNLVPRRAVADFLVFGLSLLDYAATLLDLHEEQPDPDPDVEDPDPDPDPEPLPPPTEDRAMGINLAGVTYYASELPFVDAFRTARPWISQRTTNSPWSTNVPLDLDDDGWVLSLANGQAAGTLMFRDIGHHYPAGEYVCLYDGEGTIEWRFAAELVSKEPGREVVKVTPQDAGVYLKIVKTNPADPLRNIRFFMPGRDTRAIEEVSTDRWRPGFLSRWEKFKVLRFMDWQRTNHSKLAKWDDRTTVSSATQAGPMGVALEHMVDLCNRLEADPWFCIPHLADDDFVNKFALLIFQTLDPERKVYLEHSNEVWNSHFGQSSYAREKGVGLHTEPNTATMLYHARRTVDIRRIFENVFGDQSGRLVTVLGGQSVSTWRSKTMLDHVYLGKPIAEQVDALGVAPYIGVTANAATVDKSIEQILAELRSRIPKAASDVAKQFALIGDRPIDLVAYEGGQGMRAGSAEDKNNQALTDKLVAANRDPGIAPIYGEYLRALEEAGVRLFLHFNSTREPNKHGSWGALRYYDSDESTPSKYSALVKYIGGNG